MKRLGIYFFYDKDGIVDNYACYFLQQIKKFCEELCVVVNGKLTKKSRELLKNNSDYLLERENIGFDSWAYKAAIEYYGYEKLNNYDEVILCNFTFFGPIYSLSELFTKMETIECDFWGIYRHPAINAKVAEIPVVEHIQSHFIVFRKKIVQSCHFRNYWITLQPVNSYDEAIANHELRCTQYFENLGYNSKVYLDDEFYTNVKTNASIHYAARQIMKNRSPILKRKVLWIEDNTIKYPQFTNESIIDLIHFIKTQTIYDTDLIWENLCRTQNINSIKIKHKNILKLLRYLFLHWIVPWKTKYKIKLNRLKNSHLISKERLIQSFNKKKPG